MRWKYGKRYYDSTCRSCGDKKKLVFIFKGFCLRCLFARLLGQGKGGGKMSEEKSTKKIVVSHAYQLEAIITLLEKKGIITKEEILEQMQDIENAPQD